MNNLNYTRERQWGERRKGEESGWHKRKKGRERESIDMSMIERERERCVFQVQTL